jgi:hypothetical protein
LRSNGDRGDVIDAEPLKRVGRQTYVSRLIVSLLLVGSVVLACQDASSGAVVQAEGPGTTVTTVGEATCVDPPATELEVDSALDLTVEPNPVAAGGPATLSIAQGDLPAHSIVGAGAIWQCWKGTAWVDTHQIVRAFSRGYGDAIELEPGVAPTIPAVGLEVPSTYPIMIPDVVPGIYRIVDTAFNKGDVTGFVIVEVTEG